MSLKNSDIAASSLGESTTARLASWTQILLLEDNSARAHRRKTAGIREHSGRDVVLRYHRIAPDGVTVAGESSYSPGTLGELVSYGGRAAVALDLLDSIKYR